MVASAFCPKLYCQGHKPIHRGTWVCILDLCVPVADDGADDMLLTGPCFMECSLPQCSDAGAIGQGDEASSVIRPSIPLLPAYDVPGPSGHLPAS